MAKSEKTSPLTDITLEKLFPEDLRVKLRYLRAENADLKKSLRKATGDRR
ncbi:hypothetical protein [Citrobacter amalonaticus]|nr:hypothetical protein [Citrobacter amalonaticus]